MKQGDSFTTNIFIYLLIKLCLQKRMKFIYGLAVRILQNIDSELGRNYADRT